MRIYLIAVGTRMPGWVKAGFTDYAKRLTRECKLKLIEVPATKRGKNANAERTLREEGERILAAIPRRAKVIVLDVGGQQWDIDQLVKQLGNWLREGRDVALLIGGPEGLDAVCYAHAEVVWSLSKLTFPHSLVRVIVAEQLFRAWSLLHHHPYHRA